MSIEYLKSLKSLSILSSLFKCEDAALTAPAYAAATEGLNHLQLTIGAVASSSSSSGAKKMLPGQTAEDMQDTTSLADGLRECLTRSDRLERDVLRIFYQVCETDWKVNLRGLM